jgi:hypothetical protein
MFFYGYLCIGIPLIVIGGAWWLYNLAFLSRATETTGKIVGYDNGGGGRHSTLRPIVEFQSSDGHLITFTNRNGQQSESSGGFLELLIILPILLFQIFSKKEKENTPEEVEMVQVLYDPNNPNRARIKNLLHIHVSPVLFIMLGFLVCAAGIPTINYFYTSIFSFIEALMKKIPSWLI